MFVSNSFYYLNTDHPKATLTFVAKNLLGEERLFNDDTSIRCKGGYPASSIRTHLNGNLLATLPADLQTSISEVVKISDGGDERVLKTTSDKVWLLSLEELGVEDRMDQLLGQGEAYLTFTDASSRRIKSVDGKIYVYHTRSTVDWSQVFAINSNSDAILSYYYYNTSGILIGFCI
jgi:hypothetical protein